MAINYIPFESKSGFKSPGFFVNESGDLVVDGNVQFNSQFNVAPDFTVNGILVIDDSDSVVSLGDSIKSSNLSRLGTLEFLNIDGDLTIAQGSSPYFSVVNGHIEMESFQAVGRIENMEIGLKNPAPANFTSVNIGPGDSTGELSVQGNVIITGDTVSAGTAVFSGIINSLSSIRAASQPTRADDLTRKDYVDNKISALAIALGA